MKLLAGSALFVGFLVGAFILGLVANQPFPMIGAFCLSPFALVLFGYAMGRAGIRVVTGEEDYPVQRSSNGQVAARRRLVEKEGFQ